MSEYLILGCGYTATRVAHRLIAEEHRVVCTNRHKLDVPGVESVAVDLEDPLSLVALRANLSKGMVVLNSIPVASNMASLLETLYAFEPRRMVYLSTTGVYGAAETVDEHSLASPITQRDEQRLATEKLMENGTWSALILRPAAIYGPGRGVHTSARTGIFRSPPGGDRIVSRIHVDDLAEHVVAGLQNDLVGAFPIADEEPCSSSTVAAFAFRVLNLPFQTGDREATSRDKSKLGRRVDGSAYRRALGLRLRYPTYREGVSACLQVEEASAAPERARSFRSIVAP